MADVGHAGLSSAIGQQETGSIDRLGRSTASVATALDDLEAAGVAIYASINR